MCLPRRTGQQVSYLPRPDNHARNQELVWVRLFLDDTYIHASYAS